MSYYILYYSTNAGSGDEASNLKTLCITTNSTAVAENWLICIRLRYGIAKNRLGTKIPIEFLQEEVIYNVPYSFNSHLDMPRSVRAWNSRENKLSQIDCQKGQEQKRQEKYLLIIYACPTKTRGILLKEASMVIAKGVGSENHLVKVNFAGKVPFTQPREKLILLLAIAHVVSCLVPMRQSPAEKLSFTLATSGFDVHVDYLSIWGRLVSSSVVHYRQTQMDLMRLHYAPPTN